MFIESLQVEYPESGWKLEETHFDQFNLLVGASGVGKTRILEAIRFLSELANSGDLNAGFPSDFIVWMMVFRSSSGERFVWEGKVEIEHVKDSPFGKWKYAPRFDFEKISKNGEEIASRANGDIRFSDYALPRMNQSLSLFGIFKLESEIMPLVQAFRRTILFSEAEIEKSLIDELEEINDWKKMSLDDIRNSSANLWLRLIWLKEHPEGKEVFRRLEERYFEIFPFVDSLLWGVKLPSIAPRIVWYISEPEFSNSAEVGLDEMSSGMKKTLSLLAQLELCPNRSLILIDEFENSLGVNCINFVADAIVNAKRGLQFIITSHHPYIINNVDFKHWKIVTRKGSVVSARPAKDFGLGKSKHERFFQLTNMEAFRTGQTPELIK